MSNLCKPNHIPATIDHQKASPCHEQYPTNHEYCDQKDKSLGKVVFGLHKLDIYDKPQTDDAPSEEVEEASVEKETAK
jgi:hypothetical protein